MQLVIISNIYTLSLNEWYLFIHILLINDGVYIITNSILGNDFESKYGLRLKDFIYSFKSTASDAMKISKGFENAIQLLSFS